LPYSQPIHTLEPAANLIVGTLGSTYLGTQEHMHPQFTQCYALCRPVDAPLDPCALHARHPSRAPCRASMLQCKNTVLPHWLAGTQQHSSARAAGAAPCAPAAARGVAALAPRRRPPAQRARSRSAAARTRRRAPGRARRRGSCRAALTPRRRLRPHTLAAGALLAHAASLRAERGGAGAAGRARAAAPPSGSTSFQLERRLHAPLRSGSTHAAASPSSSTNLQ